jgi:hypothetical protein
MPGRGGVGAEMALAFAAFWDVIVDVVEAGFLLTAVEVETTVLETTTAADVFRTEAGFLDEVTEGAGAAEAGLNSGLTEEGGFAEDAALEETFDTVFDGALEAAFDPAFDPTFDPDFDPAFASSTDLAVLLVTVFIEVPLIAVFVSIITISFPFATVASPVTCISFIGSALTGTAIQGVTKIGMARRISVGGGGAGVAGV